MPYSAKASRQPAAKKKQRKPEDLGHFRAMKKETQTAQRSSTITSEAVAESWTQGGGASATALLAQVFITDAILPRSFPDVARAIGVQPIGGRREGRRQKRPRPAASTLASHKRQNKPPPPPQSPDASVRISLTPDDCLPPEEVANYPGKTQGKNDDPGYPSANDTPGYPGKKGISIKFKSLSALAVDAPARGPGHEPRDDRRVRGTGMEYYDKSSSVAESSATVSGGSGGRQGSQREDELLNKAIEQGTTAESDVLCDGSLAIMLEDITLQAGGPDIFKSQSATREGEQGLEGDMSAGLGGPTQHECNTREAAWSGKRHVPAGADACGNRAAMQQMAADQGGKQHNTSAGIQLRVGPHMGIAAYEAANTDTQHEEAMQPTVDKSKAQGSANADLQQQMDEHLKIPACTREEEAMAPHSLDKKASAGKGDGVSSCSQPQWPPAVKTPVSKAAAGMLGADPDKAPQNGKACSDRAHNNAEVSQDNESGGEDHKTIDIDSDSMSDEGVEGVLAFLLHANGSLLADSSPAQPDSAVAVHIAEMQANNHVLRFELAERSRLLAESSRQLAAKNEQLGEKERQLALISRQLAKKSREYSVLAAGVRQAIQGVSAKE
ncbi:hypothetical protein COCOBI_14-4490 [Coccomyxa sp. Obi]|nr:hypothetical protein COCOBI_14-4490 [Coccomyxa sp. Obi]